MQRRLSTPLTFTILVFQICLFAGSVRDSVGRTPPSTPVAATSIEMTVRVSGVIESYDKANRVLTLTTSKGTTQFVVPPGARVREDRNAAVISDLANFIGCRVELRYSISANGRTVESVRILDKVKQP